MASVSRLPQPSPSSRDVRHDQATILSFPDRDRSAGLLASLLDREIIPRLLLAHGARRAEPARATPAAERSICAAEIVEFALAAVTEEADALLVRLESWSLRGYDDQALCLDLLAPAAKHLGALWEEDYASFADVTVGLARMHQVVRFLAERAEPAVPGPERSALFAVVPGEQHTFGVVLVAEAFRRAGWRVTVATETRAEDIVDLAAEDSFDLIGLSAVADCDVGAVRRLVRALRRSSLNRTAQIFIGGRFAESRPGFVAEVGADGGGEDARRTLAEAEALVASRVRPA